MIARLKSSLTRPHRTLKHLVQYSTLISAPLRTQLLAADPGSRPGGGLANATTATQSAMRTQVMQSPTPMLSDFPLFLSGQRKPVIELSDRADDDRVLVLEGARHVRSDEVLVLDDQDALSVQPSCHFRVPSTTPETRLRGRDTAIAQRMPSR